MIFVQVMFYSLPLPFFRLALIARALSFVVLFVLLFVVETMPHLSDLSCDFAETNFLRNIWQAFHTLVNRDVTFSIFLRPHWRHR